MLVPAIMARLMDEAEKVLELDLKGKPPALGTMPISLVKPFFY